MRTTHQLTTVTAATLCVFAALCLMTGCRDSDALKEIIYDQASEAVDYSNPEKFRINDSSSELEDPLMPASEVDDDSEPTEERQNLVVYSSKPNTPNYVAKQSLWDPSPDFQGLEASSAVHFYEDPSNPEATEQDLGEAPQEEPEDKQEEEDDGEDADDGNGGSGENGDGSLQGADPDADPNPETANDGANGDGDDDIANENGIDGEIDSDLTGSYVDVPTTNTVAAYGQLAVLVQMIGGKGALVAADSELLSSKFASIFSDEGSADIAVGWKKDGADTGTIDVDAIIKSRAGAVLVYSDSYLSKSEKKKLTDAGVNVLKVYPLTNSSYIKKDADMIGDLLEGSEALEKGWDSVAMAAKYRSFHDGLVKAVQAQNGNKLAGTTIYEKGVSTSTINKTSFDSTATTTLLLGSYDTTATYTSSIDGWKPTTNGVALATVGYSSSPVSYYIQTAGLVENAAAKSKDISTKSGTIIAWQFNGNIASAALSKWSYKTGGGLDEALDIKWDNWNTCLFTAQSAKANSDYTVSECFGSESFPVIIAGTQEVKERFIANSKDANGIYHAYPPTEASSSGVSISGFGKLTSGGSLVFSAIGTDYETGINSFDAGSGAGGSVPDDAVLVTPCGLFSSWIDASAESVLEAAWANDVVNTKSKAVGWETYVKDFYSTFYRYSLSDSELKTISAGAEK